MSNANRRLLQLGILLFLLGLFTGLAVPAMASPRLGLSSHLEGVMNGMFLVLLGLVWGHLRLEVRGKAVVFWTAVFGTYVNWATVLLAALWGAGEAMMPLAGAGQTGTPVQEVLVKIGLITLSLAMIVSVATALWGLRGRASDTP